VNKTFNRNLHGFFRCRILSSSITVGFLQPSSTPIAFRTQEKREMVL
jgi:hypothetical protein